VYLEALRNLLSSPDPRRRVLPGIRRLLDTLDAMRAVHIGLLTGNLEAGARAKLEPFGLAGYFPAGGFSSDHEDRNEIARIATEKFRQRTGFEFAPDRVHVVGDTELDVECARANGYRAVAVASGWVSAQRLREAAPDAFFDDLTDLPRVLRALGLDGRSP
jgi:phosphoglycolate phosphatase-like HAD superfamily hydrolase